jgi:hypothetical protein
MKNFAFAVALALLAVALPASAAETSSATPLMTPVQQIEGPVQPIDLSHLIRPFCWTLQGTSCTTPGETRSCTDVCGSNLSCTCDYYISNPSVKFWNCMAEC